jgi:site-specific recombinase XerD
VLRVIDGGLIETASAPSVPNPEAPASGWQSPVAADAAAAAPARRVVVPERRPAAGAVVADGAGWRARALARTGGETPLIRAFDLFLLERKGLDRSSKTISFYEQQVGEFVVWVAENHPDVRRVEDVDKTLVVRYRVYLAERPAKRANVRDKETGRLQKDSLQASQRALRTFFGWATDEGYTVDARILKLEKTKLPDKEADLYHLTQLRKMLGICDIEVEKLIVRLLVGTGGRISEIPGISLRGSDGLPDLSLDSLDRGHADLRLRWDAGTKGLKTRRVPVCTRLVTEAKRYEARHRPDVDNPQLLISRLRRPYKASGIDSLMDRLQRRVGFRVHAHAFRHTFGTVCVQMGWNLERLRYAMGHEDYDVLRRYVKLACERDLGNLKEWAEFIAAPPRPVG